MPDPPASAAARRSQPAKVVRRGPGSPWARSLRGTSAAEVLERLDKSEAENRVLKAELARVSTILASRERELVKMKGLASLEDEVF